MTDAATQVRLDELLVRRGLASSRQQARALILAGRVTVPGVAHAKPGQSVQPSVEIGLSAAPNYVSRGGVKLAHGLATFGINSTSRVCADLGASTGGFTDCLLQAGAARVFAIDVGYGQLDWRLRTDPRVTVMERTNARFLDSLPEPVSLTVVDASFISLRLLFPAIRRISGRGADIIALVKPQFEAGRDRVGKGGVVRDRAVHRDVLIGLATWLSGEGHSMVALTASPLRGPAGNVEFIAHVRLEADSAACVQQVEDQVERALVEVGAVA